MTPKRDPRSSPKRAKNDIKIDIDFGHATRLVGHEVGVVVWAGDPPLGGAPGALGRGPKRHGNGPQALMRAVKDIKHYT